MITIVDYGVGNLFSLASSLQFLGVQTQVTGDPDALRASDRVILPGVGAFADAMAQLRAKGLTDVLRELAASGKPLLGICLGMQVLFERGYEYGEHEGLGLIAGSVAPLADDLPPDAGLKIPHMGWNRLTITRDVPLLRKIKDGDSVYYVHSYYAKGCEKSTAAVSQYGVAVTGTVVNGNVMGTQFHPEKSGETGLKILKAFSEL